MIRNFSLLKRFNIVLPCYANKLIIMPGMDIVVFGQLLALLAALCGAFSSVVYSRISQKTGPDVLACLRMFIAFPVMALWGLLADGFVIVRLPVGCLLVLLASGFLGFFVTDLYYFRALASYGANPTMVVMCLAPIFSTIFSVFLFNETLAGAQYLGIVLTVVGIMITASGNVKLISYGLLCALFAAVLQSVSDMLVKASVVDVPYKTAAAIRAFGGLTGWAGFAFVRLKGKIAGDENLHDGKFLLLFVITVFIGTIAATTFGVGAIKYAPAGIVTSIKQMSPVFILPYDFFVLKKHSVSAVAGTIVALAGVVLFFV